MPIDFSSVYYTYSPKTPLAYEALKGINLHIDSGEFVALVGRTGCGKSTLVSHINALLTPSKGEVRVDEFVSSPDKKRRSKKISPLRKKVGLVFQFPEYQLFEKTVLDDVAFGPKNFGKRRKNPAGSPAPRPRRLPAACRFYCTILSCLGPNVHTKKEAAAHSGSLGGYFASVQPGGRGPP